MKATWKVVLMKQNIQNKRLRVTTTTIRVCGMLGLEGVHQALPMILEYSTIQSQPG